MDSVKLSDLPKDMLLQLIATIQVETRKDTIRKMEKQLIKYRTFNRMCGKCRVCDEITKVYECFECGQFYCIKELDSVFCKKCKVDWLEN